MVLSNMTYKTATEDQVEFFRVHGHLVVKDAIEVSEIDLLHDRCQELLERKQELALDWAWEKGKEKEQRDFKIVQANPRQVFPEIVEMESRQWTISFASALLGRPVDSWYDQYIAKPPRDGAETYWHQDEAYWGRNLEDKGITCWMPLQDVDELNGCMHFTDRGHLDGILEHARPEHIKSDLLYCQPGLDRTVVCPIKRCDVTFHHGRTPHMTTPNMSDGWRQAVTTHMSADGASSGNHYPWRVAVNQQTGTELSGEELENYHRERRIAAKRSE
jgi:phytanoyl-CoA hydroxylase